MSIVHPSSLHQLIYICAVRFSNAKSQKGQQKFAILKKTTGLCPSSCFYSMTVTFTDIILVSSLTPPPYPHCPHDRMLWKSSYSHSQNDNSVISADNVSNTVCFSRCQWHETLLKTKFYIVHYFNHKLLSANIYDYCRVQYCIYNFCQTSKH